VTSTTAFGPLYTQQIANGPFHHCAKHVLLKRVYPSDLLAGCLFSVACCLSQHPAAQLASLPVTHGRSREPWGRVIAVLYETEGCEAAHQRQLARNAVRAQLLLILRSSHPSPRSMLWMHLALGTFSRVGAGVSSFPSRIPTRAVLVVNEACRLFVVVVEIRLASRLIKYLLALPILRVDADLSSLDKSPQFSPCLSHGLLA
jgi:hypothetical protein